MAGSAAIDLGGGRRREFRRLLLVSVVLHAAGVALLAYSPGFPVIDAPAGAISVELIAAPTPGAAAARAKPKPAPAPEPAAKPLPAPPPPVAQPKPPTPETRVLPKEATLPKPAPAPRPKRRELTPEDLAKPKAQEKDYADVLDQLRSEVPAEPSAPAPAAEAPAQAPAAASAGGGGTGRPVSPEVAEWMRRARIHIRRSWVVPPGFRQQTLATTVNVELDAQGNVVGEPEIARRSGNPWYDDGVLRSIAKASPLPAPPQAGSWVFVLVSDENY